MGRKKIIEKKLSEYIIVNQCNQVFVGLKGGYPYFDGDWQKARTLNNPEQFDKVKRGTLDQLEILHL